jgi:hypothetical protein
MRRHTSVTLAAAFVAAAGCGGDERQDDDTTGVPTSVTTPGTGDASSDADDGPPDGEKLDMGVDPTGTSGIDPDAPGLCEQDVDIVFVMDVSTSMQGFLTTLANEIDAVDQAIVALDLPGAPHYGLVVFVDDHAILNTGQPYPDVATLRADFEMWASFTASNQQVGGGNLNSTWPENSLDALYAAATGFQWRPAEDTLRLVIHTTDDTFWDGPTNQNGVAIQHGYGEVVTALQERQIRTYSFAAQIGGSCECEDVTPGWSTPYQGQPPVPEATAGEDFDIDLVLAGQISLSDAIPTAVEDTMCDPYPPIG